MEEMKTMLREMLETQRQQQRATQRQLDGIESSLAAIARSLEQEDRLQERQERAEARERDKLAEDVGDLRQRIENIGESMRALPDRMVASVERKIYDLRTARWEAGQPLQRDPTPPYGTQLPYREQTGKIATANPEADDLTLTPQQQRGLVRAARAVWTHGKWHMLTVGAGGAIVGFWQKIVELFKH